MTKHLRRDVHYIEDTPKRSRAGRGGHNVKYYRLTDDARALLVNTYRTGIEYNPARQCITIMSLENQTIGFLHNAFKDITPMKRQYCIGAYRVDLCFTDHALVVECDEMNHVDRDPIAEHAREAFIKDAGFSMIRFNPNSANFDLSNVINSILHIVLTATKTYST